MAKLRAPLPAFPGGRPTIQFQAPIVQTMFQRRLPYCGVEFDTCLASCLTSSISTQSGKLDGKEAFGRHELVVLKMQSLFRKRTPEPEAIEEISDTGTERAVPVMQAPAAVVDPRMLQMLVSLRRPAWLVVCLLALIFIVLLLTR